MKKLAILLLSVALFSCKRTNTLIEHKDVLRVDTFRTEKVIERYKSVTDTLTIYNPCDSSGILTRFYSKLTVPQGKVIIKSDGNNISATIDLDSMQQIYEQNYRNSQVKWIEYRDKEIIKYRIPTWIIILLLIEFLALVAWVYLKFGLNGFK
jgi:hypothetical protein